MEDLGDLGFWLAVGMVVAAAIIAHGLKEREKERQKQETLRALLTAEGSKNTTEVLAYMRERDAAEEQLAREAKEAGDPVGAGILAFIVGLISFMAGLAIFAVVIRVAGGPTAVSLLIAVPAILAVWYGGLRLALMTYRGIRGRKKAPPPGA